jgi:hypothetical protein
MTGAESHVRQDRAPDLVTALRRAVALLRAVDHDHPRGPWRSADPEPTGPSEDPDTRPRSGVDVPGALNPTARATHNAWSGEHAADPLAAFEDLVGDSRPRFAPPTVHRVAVDRSLAGPLADLLDALADLAATTLAKRGDDDVALAAPSRTGRPWASPNGCAPPSPERTGRATTVQTVSSPTGRVDIVPERDASPSLGRGFDDGPPDPPQQAFPVPRRSAGGRTKASGSEDIAAMSCRT